jgi:hypothetical protein
MTWISAGRFEAARNRADLLACTLRTLRAARTAESIQARAIARHVYWLIQTAHA